jgi:hypothetical protein
MPGPGRGGIAPGLGRGPPGPAGPAGRLAGGRGGRAPGVAGWGPPGRGGWPVPPTPNGLLPMRGPGRGPPGRVVPAAGTPVPRSTPGTGAGSTGNDGGAGGVGTDSGTVVAGAGAGAAGAGAVAMAATGSGAGAAFFAGARRGAGEAGNASRTRRATGASTVDDALLTNSPSSPSLLNTSLLVTPSSLASSCTRALPATGLLRRNRAATRSVPLAGGLAHRWRFIECP